VLAYNFVWQAISALEIGANFHGIKTFTMPISFNLVFVENRRSLEKLLRLFSLKMYSEIPYDLTFIENRSSDLFVGCRLRNF